MYKIVCDYCGEEIIFEEVFQKPEKCSNCNSFLDQLEPQKVSEPAAGKTENQINKIGQQPCTGITLIYQKTGEKIHIDQAKVILGREGFGAGVLSEIPQISRSHCVIELIDNQYRVTDLDSFNGTYVGISKINCNLNPKQILNDSDLVFLGREPFLVESHLKAKASERTAVTRISEEKIESKEEKTRRFRCLVCAKEHDAKEEICDGCGSYGQWEVIEE
jgi:pSer/pThr/pTyr-binding forkhead associated (FHA) protein